MTTYRDFFVHLDESLTIPIQLLDSSGNPKDLDLFTVEFATALEFSTDTIEVLSSANSSQIAIDNANTATVSVYFRPTSNLGYSERNHVYQVRTIRGSDSAVEICLEGKVFIEPSLFD